jgi:hypothetical protein
VQPAFRLVEGADPDEIVKTLSPWNTTIDGKKALDIVSSQYPKYKRRTTWSFSRRQRFGLKGQRVVDKLPFHTTL